MTALLEHAFRAARELDPAEQDAVARALLGLMSEAAPAELTSEKQDAIARSRAAAARGEFASDDEVSALWARYGL